LLLPTHQHQLTILWSLVVAAVVVGLVVIMALAREALVDSELAQVYL
jgi:cytochrome c-type biogenesis protein CcmH/NrfF